VKKKKSKIIYQEDVYAASFVKASGALWVFAPWIVLWDMEVVNMPVLLCQWWSKGRIVDMCHQSLQ